MKKKKKAYKSSLLECACLTRQLEYWRLKPEVTTGQIVCLVLVFLIFSL